jgi:hypothetical protein
MSKKANGMQMNIAIQCAMTGTLLALVFRIDAENGSALSRARAKRNRDEACSCASTWRRRTKMSRTMMATAPFGDIALDNTKPCRIERKSVGVYGEDSQRGSGDFQYLNHLLG